jgi:hypothetical protein
MSLTPTRGPAGGLEPRTETAILTAYAALNKGDLVAISTVVTDGRFATTIEVNNALVLTTDNGVGIFAVAMEDIASGEQGMFALSGIVGVLIEGTPALGTAMTAQGGSGKDAITAVVNDKILGYMLELVASDGDVGSMMFDGYNGFGIKGA